jgi:hypothetical protein
MSKRSGGTPYKIASAIKVARRLYDQFSPRTPSTRSTGTKRPQYQQDVLRGHYQGRLPKPKRQARPGKVALHGHRLELERYGKAEHANVCYLGAQVAPAAAIGKSVGVAFLRMVMKRHYFIEYSSTSQQLRPMGSGTGVGTSPENATYNYFPLAIKFWRKVTPAGNVPTFDVPATAVYTFPIGASATVSAFADWFVSNVFLHPSFGGYNGSNLNNVELYAYQFVVSADQWSAIQHVNQPPMPLEGQYLTAYSVVRMHVQNVTRADGGVDENPPTAPATLISTRIDANPIKGKLMRFKDPTPVIKEDRGVDGSGAVDYGYKLQQDTNGDGLIWPNPAQTPTGAWTQLPTADMFRNCAGMANITLEPGAIKDYSLNFKFSGTIQALMKGFNTSENLSNAGVPLSAPLPSAINKQFGQSFMFALEKRMPTGPALVSVNFHYELYVGSCFGGRRKTPMTRQTLEPVTQTDA